MVPHLIVTVPVQSVILLNWAMLISQNIIMVDDRVFLTLTAHVLVEDAVVLILVI